MYGITVKQVGLLTSGNKPIGAIQKRQVWCTKEIIIKEERTLRCHRLSDTRYSVKYTGNIQEASVSSSAHFIWL